MPAHVPCCACTSHAIAVQRLVHTTPASMSVEECDAVRVSKLKEFKSMLKQLHHQHKQVIS